MNAKVQILDFAERLAMANNKGVERVLVKKMIVGLWRLMPVEQRHKFLVRVWDYYPYDFTEWDKRFPKIDDPALENVARHWGLIQPTLYDNDARFGVSFERLIRLKISPSQKQADWAKRIYGDWKRFRSYEQEPGEINVLEESSSEA